MDKLDDSGSKHFLNLLLESLFEMNRYRSARCLFGCNGQIYMNMMWLTWESAYAFQRVLGTVPEFAPLFSQFLFSLVCLLGVI